jgi:hypothetical protein
MEIGPRAAGVGGAYTAVADGADSLWWNPAGLAYVSRPEAGFAQSHWLEDFGLYEVQAAAPIAPDWGFGVGALYADYGTFNLVDNTGATQFGQYSAGDLVAAGGAARSWEDGRWSAGGTLKLIQERIESESAQGAAIDLGGRFHQDAWSGAAVLQNVGPGLRFVGQSSPMPTTMRFGGAWAPRPDVALSVDLVRPLDAGLSARVGAEYRTPDYRGLQAVLRLGYSTLANSFTGPTYGFGIIFPRGSFDFAMLTAASGESTSWLGLTMHFDSTRPAPRAPKPAPAAHPAPSEPPRDVRPPAQVLSDVMAWYRHKVIDGLLTVEERDAVLRRLLAEFTPQGVDVSEIRKELDALSGGTAH